MAQADGVYRKMFYKEPEIKLLYITPEEVQFWEHHINITVVLCLYMHVPVYCFAINAPVDALCPVIRTTGVRVATW